ncbi:hypothetical protein BsWGS_26286 [Bradybaena similaris]
MASKGTSASTTSSSLVTSRLPRSSIHTPLKPASVQDLKAKFDPGKAGDGSSSSSSAESTVAGVQKSSRAKTVASVSEPKGALAVSVENDSALLLSGSRSSTGNMLSSVSSSLHAAAQRKLASNSSTSSTLSSSTLPSSTLRSTSKSSAALTTARPFSPSSLSSSKSGSASSSGRSSPSTENSSKVVTTTATLSLAANKWEQNSAARAAKNNHASRVSSILLSPSELRNNPDKNRDSTDLPMMHISVSGSEVTVEVKPRNSCAVKSEVTGETRPGSLVTGSKLLEGGEKKTDIGSSHLGKKVSDQKATFNSKLSSVDKNRTSTAELSVSKQHSPPVQRSSKLIAKEIKIERLDSGINVTTYKTNDSSKKSNATSAVKTSSSIGVDNKSRDISMGKTTTDKSSTFISSANVDNTKLKATNTSNKQTDKTSGSTAGVSSHNKEVNTETGIKHRSAGTAKSDDPKPEFAQVKLRKTKTDPPKDASKLTSEKLDVKMDSDDVDDKRISRKISSERFERLMFDFQRGVPTETIVRRGSETDHIALQQKARELSKPQSDIDVPIIAKKKKEPSIFTEGLKVSDFVKQVNKMNPDTEGQPKWKAQRVRSQISSTASSDAGGDNFYQGIPGEDIENISDGDDDIYEKVTHRASSVDGEPDEDPTKAPTRRLGVYRKQRGSKKKKTEENRRSRSDTVSDSDERTTQSDGGLSDNVESSSSGTEYEDVSPDVVEGDGCLYEDLENFAKPTDKAVKNKTITHKLKKMFYKGGSKSKKNKAFVDSGVSAGTESEADTVDDTEEADSDLTETFSRTSSERSSGRLVRETPALSSLSTTSASATADDSGLAACQTQISVTVSGLHSPPPLPPRTTKVPSQPQAHSPPLPPRNASTSSKASLGNSQDLAMPVSPTSKSSGRVTDNKTKDQLTVAGNGHDGCDSGSSSSGKTECTDHDMSSSVTLDKLERSERKTGSTGHTSSTATAAAAPVAPGIYPDISAFPELKVDSASLYVDLEDEQIYGRASDKYVSKFQSEPLYQWYSKDKVIQNMRSEKSTSDDLSSDDEYLEDKRRPESLYEDVEKLLEKAGSFISFNKTASIGSKGKGSNKSSDSLDQTGIRDKPERRSVIEDVFKNGGSLHRALWCQMPEVIESGILDKLTDQEKKAQEAMFEIITSEASYQKSLKVLISVFLMAPEFQGETSDKCVITRRERQVLFSNIGHIKDISEEFLKDLEERWQESCYIQDICDIIHKHASQKFEPYVRYCGNQAFQDRVLNLLRLNTDFIEAVKRLEQHPDCQFLPLGSFLLLPMQRITRLPLLVDAICHRLDPSTPAHASTKKAMDSLTKVAKQCDEAAKKMQQTEQICVLKSNLEFKVKEFPLISASRFLVKQGELSQIKAEGTGRKPLSKLLGSHKEHIYLFLFNDILLVAKRKGTTFQVRDYCQRNAVHVEAIDNPDKTRHLVPGSATGIPNILFLAMLANHESRQVEMVLSCKSESERTRWIDAIMPSRPSTESERIYDCWDCPQFHCVRKYIAQQPDELNLEESDVINVTRKMADGWYEGERIRDGEKGWFPASHTEEINNSHVRARNLRLRYRLMRASQEYSQTELRKK